MTRTAPTLRDGGDFCQVCLRSLPHPSHADMMADGTGECFAAIVDELARRYPAASLDPDAPCFWCDAERKDNKHAADCIFRRAEEAMR